MLLLDHIVNEKKKKKAPLNVVSFQKARYECVNQTDILWTLDFEHSF